MAGGRSYTHRAVWHRLRWPITFLACVLVAMPLQSSFYGGASSLRRPTTLSVVHTDSRQPPHRKIMVLQQDDRVKSPEEHPFKEFLRINREYCERHGYEYLFVHGAHPLDPGVGTFWQKIVIFHKLMRERPDLEAIFIVDTDAVFHNHHLRIEQLLDLYPNAALITGSDPPWYPKPVNAGVYLLRNSERGRALVDKWLSYHKPERWKKGANGKWSCTNPEGIPCPYKSDDIDQGALTLHIWKSPDFGNDMIILNDKLINDNSWEHSFISHFAGGKGKKMIPEYLRRRREEGSHLM